MEERETMYTTQLKYVKDDMAPDGHPKLTVGNEQRDRPTSTTTSSPLFGYSGTATDERGGAVEGSASRATVLSRPFAANAGGAGNVEDSEARSATIVAFDGVERRKGGVVRPQHSSPLTAAPHSPSAQAQRQRGRRGGSWSLSKHSARTLGARLTRWLRQVAAVVVYILVRLHLCRDPTATLLRRLARTAMRQITPLDPTIAASYGDNTVLNSRYTVFNFLFCNLFEQFRRPLNFYFLLVALLQFISVIAPVNPLSTLLPLTFAFLLTAAKEGYDDVKRHRQDAAYNNIPRAVLDGAALRWIYKRNCEIRVGDVIMLRQNEEVPCDAVLLAASSRTVFIRTDNLDGEIDLKPRDIVAPPLPMNATTDASATFRSAYGDAEAGGDDVAEASASRGDPAAATSRSRVAEGRGQEYDGVADGRDASSDSPAPFVSLYDAPVAMAAKLRRLRLHCPPPNAILESFDGRAEFALHLPAGAAASTTSSVQNNSVAVSSSTTRRNNGSVVQVSLSHVNLLPQSSFLKNTERALVVAVYTGNDTKFGMNKRAPPVKWANIDKTVNEYSMIIFACQIACALVFGLIAFLVNRHVDATYWYLPAPRVEASSAFVIYPLRFFLLTTAMIPVSFKFIVDMSKYYMTMVVEWDASMAHPGSGGCKVKNSNILEDLGQIDYVLSDKTGTMTQNVMELRYITVLPSMEQLDLGELAVPQDVFASPTAGGPTWEDAVTPLPPFFPPTPPRRSAAASGTRFDASRSSCTAASRVSGPPPPPPLASPAVLSHFATVLALCNTVEVISLPEDGVDYQAASPDEAALCCGAAKIGVRLVLRDAARAIVEVHGVAEEWHVHHVFLFSSERKSMSVIAEHVDSGRIFFLVKGADEQVLAMTRQTVSEAAEDEHDTVATPSAQGATSSPHVDTKARLMTQLRQYACRGLRTLLVGQRELTRAELAQYMHALRQAELSLTARQERLDAVRSSIERDVDLLGITAVEDRLQEGVRETIGDLLAAGVRVWMITGDKVETAEQIGLSCALYAPGDRVVRVVEPGPEDTRVTDPEAWMNDLLALDLTASPAPAQRRRHHPHSFAAESSGSNTNANNSSSSPRDGGAAGGTTTSAGATGQRIIQRVLNYVDRASWEAQETPSHGTNRIGSASVGLGAPSSAELADGGGAAASRQRAVLVVQGGHVLQRILSSATLRAQFAKLSESCVSVICARTTPSQKAAIADFVRSQGHMTLAIGDGGNDVAMLQEAQVGVGIMGKEGRQAARAADFSIAQFSDLRALMFVHGQQAYIRTAFVIKYSFYKSMLIAFIQLGYNVVGTHMSGGSFWNSFALMMWNGIYTLPQTFLYCLDRAAPRVVLERNPMLYKMTRHNYDMSAAEFFGMNVFLGMVQSTLLLWMTMRIFGSGFALARRGWTTSHDVNFTVAYTALILSQVFIVWVQSHTLTYLNVLFLVGMPALYIALTLLFSSLPFTAYYGVLQNSLNVESWLAVLGMCVVLVFLYTAVNLSRLALQPNCRNILHEAERTRQTRLLRRADYRRRQSWWVRWLGFVPEAASSFGGDIELGPAEEPLTQTV